MDFHRFGFISTLYDLGRPREAMQPIKIRHGNKRLLLSFPPELTNAPVLLALSQIQLPRSPLGEEELPLFHLVRHGIFSGHVESSGP